MCWMQFIYKRQCQLVAVVFGLPLDAPTNKPPLDEANCSFSRRSRLPPPR